MGKRILYFLVVFFLIIFLISSISSINNSEDIGCNDFCRELYGTEGICGGSIGDVVGSRYCEGSVQCVCAPPTCQNDNDCKQYQVHFKCLNNQCLYPDCDAACKEFYNYEFGLCGADNGIDVGSAYCGHIFEQWHIFEQCMCVPCIDSDGGKNYYVKGTTKGINDAILGGETEATDICDGNTTLKEYVCTETNNKYPVVVGLSKHECPNGCEDGACIGTIECDSDADCEIAYAEGYICQNGACIPIPGCTDTDGKNYYTKGYATGKGEDGYFYNNVLEGCSNVPSPQGDLVYESDYLVEFYCENNLLKFDIYTCPNGCREGVCIQLGGLEIALKIDSPKDRAIIDKPIEIIFTIKNTEDRILEFKEAVPFEDPNGNALQLVVEDMGRQWNLWSTGDIRDGELIELKLNPGESVTKTIEFDPNYDPHFKFAGDVKIILTHYKILCTFDYGEERCSYDFGELGSDEISVNIPFTSNILIERDVGEFKYEASEVEGPFTEAFEGWTGKQHAASYIYKNIPIVAMILRLGSISQAEDYFLNKMLEDARKTVPISLIEINGNEVYAYNNHTFWISGIDVVFVGDKTVLSTGAIGGDISLDLAQAYLERFPSDIGKEEIEPVCGNGICEGGETNQNCPVDCSCQGCVLDNKCYPFGYRKKGEYCSDNYEFVGQIEAGSSCDNNFECKSNVCVNDECVSGNLIQRIIEWFKRLFGIG